MSRIIAQVVAIVAIVVGWAIVLGGTTLTYLWIDKGLIITVMPPKIAAVMGALPDYVFFLPAACVFLLGLVITAIGHSLQTVLEISPYPVDDTGSQRSQYDF